MGSICVNHHIDRGQVIAHTERDGYVNPYTQFGTRWSIVRVGVLDCVPEQRKYCIKVRINIKAVNTQDLGLWYVGFDKFSTDTIVPFQVAEVRVDKEKMIGRSSTNPSNTTAIPSVIIQGKGAVQIVQTKDLKEVIEVETGFGESNLWLEWIQYTARSVAREECYACANAKPQLTTIPFPLNGINSPKGMACMVKLFMKAGMPNNDSCIDLHYLYPQVPLKSRLPPFTVTRGEYYCLARYSTHGKYVGEVGTCNKTENITTDETMSDLTGWLNSGDFKMLKVARADIWWLCGGMSLTDWTG
nr:uncharacterized protein LOC115137900 [Oncorhynchus nerka]